MPKSIGSIIGLLIFLVIVVGAGILIYRFVTNDDTSAKVLTVNNDGKFAEGSYSMSNTEVFRIQNNSDKNQTVKKSSDKTTLVEIDSKSSSRELSLSDNSETELFLAGDESQKTKVRVGNPPAKEQTETPPVVREDSGTTAGATQNLPNTGPANNLIFLGIAFLGFGLHRLSTRMLNKSG